MKADDAFSGQRFEYDDKHLYYLPPKMLQVLEQNKPVYMIGSRGSGKTTLLKCLNWHERITNPSLRSQIGCDPFIGRYISVYLKLPELQLSVLQRTFGNFSSYCEVLSVYLDLLWGELVLQAVTELLSDGHWLTVETDREYKSVMDFLMKYESKFKRFLPKRRPLTFHELCRAFQRMHLELITSARIGLAEKELAQEFPLAQIGEVGRDLADSLVKAFRGPDDDVTAWSFKVCFDEGECLNVEEQKVINTMVRLSHHPLMFIEAFVNYTEDLSSTYIPGLSLADADRVVLLLDNMGENEFLQFAEGVATVRARHFLKKNAIRVELNTILGNLNLNRTLTDMLRSTTSLKARRLLEHADLISREPFFSNGAKAGSALPIYQTYLIEKLNIMPSRPEDPNWVKRGQNSREIRKRMVVAYLSICREFGLKPRYSSSRVLIQLCDNCIRDFLHFMQALVTRAGVSLPDFLGKRLSDTEQDAALRKASEEKSNSLQLYGVRCPDEVWRMIHGLARLTSELQSASAGGSHLRSSERGKFILLVPAEISGTKKQTLEMVTDAAEAGYFRLLSEPGDPRIQFRVHTSLAPYYEFSYRGAYYDTQLSVDDLVRLREARGTDELKQTISQMASKYDQQAATNQPYLQGMAP